MKTDRRRQGWNKVAGRVLYVIALLSFIATLTVHSEFYADGSRHPNAELGQTFPLHTRGVSANSYITEHQAGIMYAFLGVAVLSALFGFLLYNLGGIDNETAGGTERDRD
jgi:hypothetical protein